jgi:heme-degrading monooxygenase HmoA
MQITRIVKLTFNEAHIQDFLSFFDTINTQVSRFPGCRGMRLLRDIHRPNIVFTYSYWDSEEALNAYRDSELFGKVWPAIKPWFGGKAEAWTVETYFGDFRDQR